ncbi:MAG: hypothetical protein ACRD1Q_15070 [Vicinamibacterales bacterium]
MVVEGLDTTNFWLAVMAIVSVIQICVLVAGAWFCYHLYVKTTRVANELEARYLMPLSMLNTRVNGFLDEAEDIAVRVKDAESAVRNGIRHVADTGNVAVAAVRARSWPIVGILRGLRVAMDVLFDNWPPPRGTYKTPSTAGRASTWSQS